MTNYLEVASRRYAKQPAQKAFLLVFQLLYSIASFAQTPLSSPNIDLWANGVIYAAATSPVDGSVIVGGDFTAINGQPRQNLAKINADGTLDASWNPTADGRVYAVTIDGSGNVYVGGAFSFVNGHALSKLAKLAGNGNGAPDITWNPAPDNLPIRLATDSLGSVYAAGYFQNIGGQTRNGLAKLSSSTSLADSTWNPAPDNNDVSGLCVDASGNVFVSGNFENIGGQARHRLAKLASTGSGAADSNWNTAPGGTIAALAVDASGSVYVGGDFILIGGQQRPYLAKLAGTGAGALDPTWNPNPDNPVGGSFALDGTGHIYVSGSFTSIGGQAIGTIAKLSTTGSGAADPAWNAGSFVLGQCLQAPCASVNALALTTTGRLVIGGTFASIGGLPRLGLAALSIADATSQAPINALLPAAVYAIAAQPGGGMIVGGNFELADQLSRNNLLRLNADSSLDASWNPGANGSIYSLAIDGTGFIYVAGAQSLAKLTSSGSIVSAWAPALGGYVWGMSLSTSGDLYVGGNFSAVSGQTHLAKIATSTGAVDATWNPNANGPVFDLAVDEANSLLYISGFFSQVGGQAHQYVARISSGGVGAVDANWNPNPDGQIGALAIDNSGALFVGGFFANIGGQPRNGIAKIDSADGSANAIWSPSACQVSSIALDGQGALYAGGCSPARFSTSGTGVDANLPSWGPQTDGDVLAIALDSNKNVYVGGSFTTIGGKLRSNLAALPSDTIFANGFE